MSEEILNSSKVSTGGSGSEECMYVHSTAFDKHLESTLREVQAAAECH